MELGLDGVSALVTGASRGIGRSIARSLAGEGARVTLVARGREGLEEVASEIRDAGGSATVVSADLTEEAAAGTAVARASEEFGAPLVVVSNAGGRHGSAIDDLSSSDFSSTLDFNAGVALRLAQAAIPGMRVAGWGRIVTVSSIYGREAGGSAAYNAGKAALISLTKSMARAVAGSGITVNSVAPGSIMFPGGSWARRQEDDPEGIRAMIDRDLPLGRFGHPDEVAAAVTFLCARQASLITGACLVVDGAQGRSNI